MSAELACGDDAVETDEGGGEGGGGGMDELPEMEVCVDAAKVEATKVEATKVETVEPMAESLD